MNSIVLHHHFIICNRFSAPLLCKKETFHILLCARCTFCLPCLLWKSFPLKHSFSDSVVEVLMYLDLTLLSASHSSPLLLNVCLSQINPPPVFMVILKKVSWSIGFIRVAYVSICGRIFTRACEISKWLQQDRQCPTPVMNCPWVLKESWGFQFSCSHDEKVIGSEQKNHCGCAFVSGLPCQG